MTSLLDTIPLVSVITPTRAEPARMGWFHELWTSLQSNRVKWEWVVVVDGGESANIPIRVAGDERVRVVSLSRSHGAASARNVGLEVARGDYVTSADDDDLLPTGSLDVRANALLSNPTVDWVGGQLDDLSVDGIVSTWECPAGVGYRQAGEILGLWEDPTLPPPLGPTTMMIRSDTLRKVGGWQGLPQGEDLGMMMALTAVSDGLMLPDSVYIYRKHPGQSMETPAFDELEQLVRTVAIRRARLLREPLP